MSLDILRQKKWFTAIHFVKLVLDTIMFLLPKLFGKKATNLFI